MIVTVAFRGVHTTEYVLHRGIIITMKRIGILKCYILFKSKLVCTLYATLSFEN